MNRQTKWLLAIAPLVLLAGWAATFEIRIFLRARAVAQHERERRAAEIDSVRSFAASTNAIVDWQKTLCNGDTSTHLFSTDLENVVVRPDGRGLLFYGELKDIVPGKDGAGTAVFAVHGCMDTKIELRLTVDADLVQTLQASRNQPIPYFVLAATITNVGKPASLVATSGASGSSTGEGEVIVAKGRAFGVLYIGVDGYQFEELRGDLPSQ